MRLVAVIQARMGSTRFPGKVLRPVSDVPMLARIVAAARSVPALQETIVATGEEAANDPLAIWCTDNNVQCLRGSDDDVLSRMVLAAEHTKADAIVRLTADCPVVDPNVIAQVVALFIREGVDYASNVSPPTWPDGLDCEVVSLPALQIADREAIRASDREHVTPFIRNNRARFLAANLSCPLPGMSGLRWTVDTPDDITHLEMLFTRLSAIGKRIDGPVSWTDLLWAEEQLDGVPIPDRQNRNVGYQVSQGLDQKLGNRPPVSFERSAKALERAERLIPLGAQTFSKSKIQFPIGAAPLFLTAGKDGRVWDVDGNEFVDLINGLLCVSLGYCDPDIDAAARRQIDRGISFSLSTELEAELAERLVRLIPSAEKVRFGKNGSDATSAAVRVARAYTGRDRVIVCGYHGWHDWYIATTSRVLGIPAAIRDLSHTVPYNDLDAMASVFAAHPGQIACIVMEVANAVPPQPGYLESLKQLAHDNGALLVFDEIITGFRFAMGGAQQLFGVTPDLSCFGKGMANGWPISALVGRADVMDVFEDIFVSGTFGGEAVSLAAAIATIDKMEKVGCIDALWKTGNVLANALNEQIQVNGLGDTLSLKGFDPWRLLGINDAPGGDAMAIKTFLIYQMARRGVLTLGSHNISYAHNAEDIHQVVDAYSEVLPILADKLSRGVLEQELDAPKIVPLFKVR
ncbi:MAG: aminotransferase class III-fold pyridoxal phosphate-dependent enzyme [Alphaproteobacteria bacterium]|nr:aminotransferase class III-fold pyridoxal phosphate-dependent enzyme [Alphaproteobacteria bacterium]